MLGLPSICGVGTKLPQAGKNDEQGLPDQPGAGPDAPELL